MKIPLNTDVIRCPNCGRLIPAESATCRYCDYEITASKESNTTDFNGQSTSKTRKKTAWLIIGGILLLFTLITVINTIVKNSAKSDRNVAQNTETTQSPSQAYSHEPEFDSNNGGTKVINNPSVADAPNKMRVSIGSVTIADDYTAVKCYVDNTHKKYSYIAIDAETYLVANGNYLQLTDTDGIAVSPGKTAISKGYVSTFTLYFPAIPQNTKSIDLVESGKTGWKFYGIRLR